MCFKTTGEPSHPNVSIGNKKMAKEEELNLNESSQPLAPTKRLIQPPRKLRLKAPAKEVLHLLTVEFLTPVEIIQRRKTSPEAVYKIIRNLKKKGLINGAFEKVNLEQSTQPLSQPLEHQIRLHGQEWNIKLISKSEKYIETKQRANRIVIDGNTIRLYNDSLEIYSGQSFFEKDENRATAVSLAYWERFFARLEHEFDVILVKARAQNISLVNQHYGEINSEMATDALEKKEKISITTDEDGKIWFEIDNSWNMKEMETKHPETAKPDMTKVRKQVNDWRENDPPTNSELSRAIIETSDQLKTTHSQIAYFAQHMESHVTGVKKLGDGADKIWNAIDKLTKVVKELKDRK